MITIDICGHECSCCINKIYSSMSSPNEGDEWRKMEKQKLVETPLHRAAAVGNTAVAVEILNLVPSLGRKLNPEGLSPLHVAIKEGKKDTAITLASFEKQLVRVKGKGGETPLMLCAVLDDPKYRDLDDPKYRDYCDYRELLASLLVECPDSVADVNNRNQTVVHVALENKGCEIVHVLINWLRRTDQLSSVLSVKDVDGNTALHAAAKYGCIKSAEKLMHLVKLNRLNSERKTALDLAEGSSLAEVLEKKGGRKGKDLEKVKTTVEYVLSKPTNVEAVSRAYFYLTQELTLEMRSTVLVVATLIIAATYQVVLQPPAGIYPPPGDDEQQQTQNLVAATPPPHMPGQMVMRWTQYHFFMPLNTFAFALSAVIIIFVVPGSPIFLILHVCLVFMCLSYILALDAISYYTNISNMIYFMALYAIFGAFIVKLLYYPVKALLVEEDWWLRRFSVNFSNLWSKYGPHWAPHPMSITYRIKKQHSVLYSKQIHQL